MDQGPLLILGSGGQVGSELLSTLTPLGKVVGLSHVDLDVLEISRLKEVLRDVRPRWIINAVGYTDVDRAEVEKDLARKVNLEFPAILAKEARQLGSWLVHFSTDYVFDGKKSEPYREIDIANPLNYYGVTKLEAEIAIRETHPLHFIFRLSGVYSLKHPRNFVQKILWQSQLDRDICVVRDRIASPTWSRSIAEAVSAVLINLTKKERPEDFAGTYHLASHEPVSWYEFASAILELHQRKTPSKSPRLVSIASSNLIGAARRPLCSALSVKKLERTFPVKLLTWRGQLEFALR